MQLAPFCDVGHSWNTQRGEASPHTLAAAGLGLRAAYERHLRGELTWGRRLRHIDAPEDRKLQDDGLQFAISASF